eukprot:3412658-Lingulodinium_polyedra.AAC.1
MDEKAKGEEEHDEQEIPEEELGYQGIDASDPQERRAMARARFEHRRRARKAEAGERNGAKGTPAKKEEP